MKNNKKGDNMRLDKFITETLNVSRKDAKQILKSKNILVDNAIITDGGYNLKKESIVLYNGKELIYKENIYLMMNKKKGYVSANQDKYHKTVFDLIDNKKYNINKLFTVGRLDIDTTGLLLITSDGDFSHYLTSPKNNISKTYYVETDNSFPDNAIYELREGIKLIDDDKKEYLSKPAKIEYIDEKKDKAYITVTEGKFHEVKKLCGHFGLKVLNLHRISIGKVVLDKDLQEGMIRELTEEEIEILKK